MTYFNFVMNNMIETETMKMYHTQSVTAGEIIEVILDRRFA